VGSLEISQTVLWDLHQTMSDLICENYALEFRRLANRHGLRIIDRGWAAQMIWPMAARPTNPMCEFWSYKKFMADYSCHAEWLLPPIPMAKTSSAPNSLPPIPTKWPAHPGNIKELGDWAFCQGVNRFVIHRFAAQPWKVYPGQCPWALGLHYERTQTWWEMSKPWHTYLARCQQMLRQGSFVADVAYLQPEGAPRKFAPPAGAEIAPHLRGGYNFDGCNAEVVLNMMTGRMEGSSFRMA
jgi:hypothetical protein